MREGVQAHGEREKLPLEEFADLEKKSARDILSPSTVRVCTVALKINHSHTHTHTMIFPKASGAKGPRKNRLFG